ncbi:MAG TPA: hypothetical protein G4O02_15785 [Caldilineae bacterium]|nr:hypothetical protein [Caldilineae bacterium]
MEVVDDYTVRLHLKEFYYPLLLDLGCEFSGKIVSPTAVDPQGDPTGKLVNYIGTGPFKLVDYKKDQEAILVRNEDYWGQKPKLEKVVWKTVPDPHTQILALKAGELGIIGAPEHHSSVPYVEIRTEERPQPGGCEPILWALSGHPAELQQRTLHRPVGQAGHQLRH